MNYFNKAKNHAIEAAKKASSVINSVSAAASELAVSNGLSPANISDAVSNKIHRLSNINNNNNNDRVISVEEFMLLFKAICEILDTIIDAYLTNSEEDIEINQSKIKNHLKLMITTMEKESINWFHGQKDYQSQLSGGLMTDMPCINALISNHILQELCERASKDIPCGCLPLMLTTASALLRQIKYPLILHQTIYKPIEKLIRAATRFDAIQNSNYSKTNNNYTNRIDIGLTSLITTIWRLIAENHSILQYFSFDELSNKTSTMTPRKQFQSHMDIITALIPLLYKPHIGLYAKESLFIALNLRDESIDRFVIDHTRLIDIAVENVCKSFQTSLDVLLSTNQQQTNSNKKDSNSNGFSTPTANRKKDMFINTASNSYNPNDITPLDDYKNAIQFCNSIVIYSYAKPTNTTKSESANRTSIGEELLEIFCETFLNDYLRNVINTNPNGELQTISVNSLINILLSQLSMNGHDSKLLKITSKFLIGISMSLSDNNELSLANLNLENKEIEEDISIRLITRATTAVSLNVSVSSLHLLTVLINVSSIEDCYQILQKPNTLVTSEIKSSSISSSKYAIPAYLTSLNATNHTFETKLTHLCVSLISLSNSNKRISNNNNISDEILYIDGNINQIISKLNDKISIFIDSDNITSILKISSVNRNTPLLLLIFRKLSSFLSLKYDEQLALTGLVDSVICCLCAFVAISSDNACNCFDIVLEILTIIELLWSEVLGFMSKIQDYENKVDAMRHILLTNSDTSKVDSTIYKLIEKESPQVKRILESGILVKEFLNEIRGYLHAIRGFKNSIKDINNKTNLNMTSDYIIDSISDDDDDDDDDDDNNNLDDFLSLNSDNEDAEHLHKNKNKTISAPLLNQLDTYESEFLSEFSSLEKNLNNLII